jgi:hypothetical protein
VRMHIEEVPKKKKVKKPDREPDMISKRGVPYWFGPNWVRDLNGTIGRVFPRKFNDKPMLCMVSKDGNVSIIEGSIQHEFMKWHQDRQLDYILLGGNEDDIIECNWEYVDV